MGRSCRKLDASVQRDIHGLFTRSAGDLLDHWFESAQECSRCLDILSAFLLQLTGRPRLVSGKTAFNRPHLRDSRVARVKLPRERRRSFGVEPARSRRKTRPSRRRYFSWPLELDQLWAARPVLGCGDYRTPLKSLYLCGSGTNPGGGVTGIPGHNAAREILRDRADRV